MSVQPNDFHLSATLKSQRALGRNLDGSERLELSRSLPTWANVNSQWSVLVNWGPGRETTLQNMRELSDVALGWVGKGSNCALVKAYLAHRLDSPAVSETDTVDRFLIQAGWLF